MGKKLTEKTAADIITLTAIEHSVQLVDAIADNMHYEPPKFPTDVRACVHRFVINMDIRKEHRTR